MQFSAQTVDLGPPDALPAGGSALGAPFGAITVPVIVPPVIVAPLGLGAGHGTSHNRPAPQRKAKPVNVETNVRKAPPPANAPTEMHSSLPPSSFRVGYVEYLRTAKMSQIALVAVPGGIGLLALTGIGGLVGFRQAKAGRAIRNADVARFMNS
jgi:hypothetical protein